MIRGAGEPEKIKYPDQWIVITFETSKNESGITDFFPCERNNMVTLKEGDKAPLFSGTDQEGKKISLSALRGKKVILYFYPEDDTPTCTVQACNLRDNYGILKKNGFEVIGISPDNENKHRKFREKFNLPFTLVADTSRGIMEKYGVWDKKKLFGHEYMGVLRTTFIIDEKGVIQKIFLRPRSKAHAGEILSAMKK